MKEQDQGIYKQFEWAVLEFDSDLKILSLNQPARHLFKVSKAENLKQLFPKRLSDELARLIQLNSLPLQWSDAFRRKSFLFLFQQKTEENQYVLTLIPQSNQGSTVTKKASDRFESIFRHNNVGIAVTRIFPNGSIIEQANLAFARILGYRSPKALLGKSVREITHPDDWLKSKMSLDQLNDKNLKFSVQKRYIKKDSSTVWCQTNVTRVNQLDGEVDYYMATIVDVHERVALEEELRKSELKFREIIENSQELIQNVDARGKILYVNREWLNKMDCTGQDLRNRDIFKFIHPSQQQHCVQLLSQAFKGETFEGLDVNFVSKSGRELHLHGRVMPVYEDGEVIQTLGFFKDVTDTRKAQAMINNQIDELNKKNEELQTYIQSNLELENFAYIASHDLREPLRTITIFTQKLKGLIPDEGDSRIQSYFDFVLDASKNMNGLIEDLLQYSRVNTEAEEAEKLPIERLLSKILLDLKAPINKTSANIQFDLPEGMAVMGSRFKINQLFQNLISNAIKFNKTDEVPEVKVSAVTDGDFWRFCVADNGIGIDPNFHDKIFLIFKRLHSRRDYEGTGIGLAICKKVVNRHGGKIWLDSSEGEGCRFYFTLPKA